MKINKILIYLLICLAIVVILHLENRKYQRVNEENVRLTLENDNLKKLNEISQRTIEKNNLKILELEFKLDSIEQPITRITKELIDTKKELSIIKNRYNKYQKDTLLKIALERYEKDIH